MELAEAQRVLDAAVAHASGIGVAVSVAVVDERGHEVLCARMDGTPWFTPHVARTKARSCVALGMDSADVAALDAAYPGLVRLIEEQVGHTVTGLGGGVLVTGADDESATVLGAVAASGATPEQDAEVARAAAAAWLARPA